MEFVLYYMIILKQGVYEGKSLTYNHIIESIFEERGFIKENGFTVLNMQVVYAHFVVQGNSVMRINGQKT